MKRTSSGNSINKMADALDAPLAPYIYMPATDDNLHTDEWISGSVTVHKFRCGGGIFHSHERGATLFTVPWCGAEVSCGNLTTKSRWLSHLILTVPIAAITRAGVLPATGKYLNWWSSMNSSCCCVGEAAVLELSVDAPPGWLHRGPAHAKGLAGPITLALFVIDADADGLIDAMGVRGLVC